MLSKIEPFLADTLVIKNDKLLFLFETWLVYIIPYIKIIFIEDIEFDLVVTYY